ncbi:unnamed protein product [Peronospora belbahrii]|uniref:Uncharacterized protein n=1 Tax=Peronospora belbahrii TaxID=622444 RepID=A0AAU9KUJ5_9STRA|nr:unnamed protein product [Peronospora belbahrii]CAH0476538.1 unnamed protein product [Peronospora belbahrii]
MATTHGLATKGDEGSEKAALHGNELKENMYVMDQHGGNHTGSEDEFSYDPLLGGDSLIKQVHDDYQERLAQRNVDA